MTGLAGTLPARGQSRSATAIVLLLLLADGCTAGATQRRAASQGSTSPISLVVLIAVDQLRPDYFRRYAPQLTGGLRRILEQATFFERGRQFHAITETAPGHSTMLSGREPARTGIVNNENGVEDPGSPVIDAPTAPGASPHNFRGTTLYDWMVTADPATRMLSVSRKDRAAILPVGRARGPVYWYHEGRFTTSRYYADSLPGWVQAFNARRSADWFAGATWDLARPATDYGEPDAVPWESGGEEPSFPHRLPAEPQAAARNLIHYPWMDSLIGAFALEGVRQLGLGQRRAPDLLSASFSTTDAVGHRYGPDSRELHDHLIRLDRWLGWFLDSLATLVPAERTIVVLTADHGVQSYPEIARRNGVPGAARIWLGDLAARMGSDLAMRYRLNFELSFDRGLIAADTMALRARGIPVDSLARVLAKAARARRGVARVFTPATLQAAPAGDREAMLWKNQIPAGFGWLICTAIEPGFVWSAPGGTQAEHGSTAPADVTVPIAFLGPGIPAARLGRPVRTVDIAPTLAALIRVRPTEALDGVVLPEIVGSLLR